MTTDEKRMLTAYRQQGLGYKKIAQFVNVNEKVSQALVNF